MNVKIKYERNVESVTEFMQYAFDIIYHIFFIYIFACNIFGLKKYFIYAIHIHNVHKNVLINHEPY